MQMPLTSLAGLVAKRANNVATKLYGCPKLTPERTQILGCVGCDHNVGRDNVRDATAPWVQLLMSKGLLGKTDYRTPPRDWVRCQILTS